MFQITAIEAVICVVAAQLANVGESLIGASLQDKEGFQWVKSSGIILAGILISIKILFSLPSPRFSAYQRRRQRHQHFPRQHLCAPYATSSKQVEALGQRHSQLGQRKNVKRCLNGVKKGGTFLIFFTRLKGCSRQGQLVVTWCQRDPTARSYPKKFLGS